MHEIGQWLAAERFRFARPRSRIAVLEVSGRARRPPFGSFSEEPLQVVGGSSIGVVRNVGVQAHRERRVGVAEAMLDDPGMLVVRHHEGRRDVAKAVERQR